MSLEYFKDPKLQELFNELKNKYIKTSRLTGTITLKITNEEAASKISRLIGENIKVSNPTIVKIKNIEKSLSKTKFENISLIEILKYLYPNMVTNKEQQNKKIIDKEKLINEFRDYYLTFKIGEWFNLELEKKDFYNKTITLLMHDKSLIYNIVLALDNLPSLNNWQNLSVFSSKITASPHYFDLDSKNSNNLLWYLSKYLNQEYNNARASKIEILNSVGIYIDSYSNFVITYNFLGDNYINELNIRKETIIFNLDNIEKLKHIYAKNKKVIILENPSLLSDITNLNTDCAFIISSGNPNIAVYQLLDKLKDHKLYYNGDFDPEGLLIADKLNNKYFNLTLIGYNKNNYNTSLSNNIISESRLKKLSKITSPELNEIKELILCTKKSGYQEKIISELITYIKTLDK